MLSFFANFLRSSEAFSPQRSGGLAVIGSIDSITPSLISGWASHPEQRLNRVALVVGPHRLVAAPFTLHRADVQSSLGLAGLLGFCLEIPEHLPLVQFGGAPTLVTLNEGQMPMGPLYLSQGAALTAVKLAAALDPHLRGLSGHCDGLSQDGQVVSGWASQGKRSPCVVWFHAAGQAPKPLACDEVRRDIQPDGQPLSCGFRLALPPDLDPSRDKPLISFDQRGLLPLPGFDFHNQR
jgi:hypothetical protein